MKRRDFVKFGLVAGAASFLEPKLEAQQDDDRIQVLSERDRPEVPGALVCDPQHSERRSRGAAEHDDPHRRLLPPAAQRAETSATAKLWSDSDTHQIARLKLPP